MKMGREKEEEYTYTTRMNERGYIRDGYTARGGICTMGTGTNKEEEYT